MNRYNVFIREHQIVRFSVEVETEGDLHAAIEAARVAYETSGATLAAQAEMEIDDAEIFAVDEINDRDGSIGKSWDLESVSASIGEPIDLTVQSRKGAGASNPAQDTPRQDYE